MRLPADGYEHCAQEITALKRRRERANDAS
jgi:hypothetical protein